MIWRIYVTNTYFSVSFPACRKEQKLLALILFFLQSTCVGGLTNRRNKLRFMVFVDSFVSFYTYYFS